MSKKVQGQIRVKGELPAFIAGRISGIIDGVVCRVNYIQHALGTCCNDTFFRVDCTKKQFENICKLVEARYSKMFEIECSIF